MPPVELGSTLDELLGADPEDLAESFADAYDHLKSKIRSQKVGGPSGLPDISADLDEDQSRVVTVRDRTIRLLAPAGAGKTHCIANRLLSLRHEGILKERILVVTFDRNSANELRGRCQDILGADSPAISTLNALGQHLLKKYKWEGQGPTLLAEPHTAPQGIAKDVLSELLSQKPSLRSLIPTDLKRRYFLQLFSYLKNQLYSPRLPAGRESMSLLAKKLSRIRDTAAAPLFAQVQESRDKTILVLAALDWLFRRYEQRKEAAGYFDFDDQKLLAYEMLADSETLRHTVQRTLDHLIVDECQDLNELDFRLLLELAGDASLMVVGDDDQSIYAFRGTSPSYIIDFEQLSARPTTTIELRRNYRSPHNLVAHASRLIQHNTYRVPKSPIPTRPETCDIRVVAVEAPSLEAALIGDFIERSLATPGMTHRDIAVLFRMNSQSLPLQLEFVKRGIPYYCRKEDNILGQEYLPRVIAVLRYVSDLLEGKRPAEHDFIQLCRAYFRIIREADYDRLLKAAKRSGPSALSILEDPLLSGTKIAQSNIASAVRALLGATTPLQVLSILGTRFKGLRGMIGTLEQAADQELPLGELGDVAIQFTSMRSFTEFLEEAVRRASERHTDDYDSDAVRLLTYFRSKGSQFETVILPGLNEGVIPHGKADVEDERRLFYVAVTRSKRNLWLSFVKRACNAKINVSRFLGELELPQASWV